VLSASTRLLAAASLVNFADTLRFHTDPALDACPGLRTMLAVESIRGVNGSGTVEAEIRYFLSSCRDDPKVLIQAIRRHWTIKMGSIGSSMSRSGKMTAVSGTGLPHATWPSCARSPSTS
jgi:hypothetical protein